MSKYSHYGHLATAATFAASYLRGLYNRPTYSNFSNSNAPKTMAWKTQKRFRRGGSRTTTKRRRRFKRRNVIRRKVRRISRKLHGKGIYSTEIKYVQNTGVGHPSIEIGDPDNPYGISGISELGAFPTEPKLIPSVAITQGTGRSGRVGSKVFLRHFRLKGSIWASLLPEAANEVAIRFLVIRTKNAQGNVTDTSSLAPFLDTAKQYINDENPVRDGGPIRIAVTPGSERLRAQLAWANGWNWMDQRWKNDFEILKFKTYKISKPEGVHNERIKFKWNIRIMKPAFWNSANEAQDGHIICYWWADSPFTNAVVPTEPIDARPSLAFSWRLTYTDV